MSCSGHRSCTELARYYSAGVDVSGPVTSLPSLHPTLGNHIIHHSGHYRYQRGRLGWTDSSCTFNSIQSQRQRQFLVTTGSWTLVDGSVHPTINDILDSCSL